MKSVGKIYGVSVLMAISPKIEEKLESTFEHTSWSTEELKPLEEHSHLSARVAQATLFPNRTRYAVQKARERMKKKNILARKALSQVIGR